MSVICGFWIYYYDLLIIHQAKLQLIITLSIYTPGLLATRYIFTGRLLALWTSHGKLLPRTNLELNWLHLELESRYIAFAPTTQKTPHAAAIVACLLHHRAATVATLCFASQRIHWCAACCSAMSGKHSYFYCCTIVFRGFCVSTVTRGANMPHCSLLKAVSSWTA
jgi:hypothetical protein